MNATTLPPQRLYPTRPGAHILGMSEEMLRWRIRQGQIRAVKIGGRFFVPAVEIDRLLALEAREGQGA